MTTEYLPYIVRNGSLLGYISRTLGEESFFEG